MQRTILTIANETILISFITYPSLVGEQVTSLLLIPCSRPSQLPPFVLVPKTSLALPIWAGVPALRCGLPRHTTRAACRTKHESNCFAHNAYAFINCTHCRYSRDIFTGTNNTYSRLIATNPTTYLLSRYQSHNLSYSF